MVRLKTWWQGFMNVAVLLSFIMNFVFLIVLIILVILIFDIKRGLVQPIVDGLHSSFVGLDQSTIISTVKVDSAVPVDLMIPLQTNTTVTLTGDVPVRANATFNLPGGGGTINGSVSIVLPTGLNLPVSLNLIVPVHDHIQVKLDVPVNIRVQDTQLHDPIDQLRSVLEPFVRLLGNLPNNWGEVWAFTGNILSGNPVNLLAPNQQSLHPWPGFRTGLGTPNPTLNAVATAAAISGTNIAPGSVDFGTPIPGVTIGAITGATVGTPIPFMTPTHSADLGIITPMPH